jgi:hypothetical protein
VPGITGSVPADLQAKQMTWRFSGSIRAAAWVVVM